MFGISSAKWKWILAILILANIGYYFYNGWGLVTVKVKDAPLGKVVRSIEWQGWVKIYTNLPPDSKVTMYVDHVSLAEAMESLAANVDVPPAPDGDGGPNSNQPNRTRPRGGGGGFGGLFGPPPGAGGTTNAGGQAAAPGGVTRTPPPGGRGGGFGGRAQWNLAFFVAPTAAQVKTEIRAFESGDAGDDADAKVYTYGTQIQLIADDNITTTPDPRLQNWAGYKPPDPSEVAAASQASASASPDGSVTPADPTAPTTPTMQTYLQAFAQSANIWIMAPDSWSPPVSAPPPGASIIDAVKNFVSGSHGAVTQAFILRAGRGGARGGTQLTGDDAWADRMLNAINGLPADQRPDAIAQLHQEVQFRKALQALPPEQRRQKMAQHFAERMLYGERLSRLSPEKRAKVYQRMIMMRTASRTQ
jgi:hypothetical protein